MILFPAIDLKDGQCVRLVQGEMDQATVFNADPAAQAKAFEEQGFEWLHVVDLNGAFEGKPVNEKAVEAIFAATHLPIQLGGGIRDRATLELLYATGGYVPNSSVGRTFQHTVVRPPPQSHHPDRRR